MSELVPVQLQFFTASSGLKSWRQMALCMTKRFDLYRVWEMRSLKQVPFGWRLAAQKTSLTYLDTDQESERCFQKPDLFLVSMRR